MKILDTNCSENLFISAWEIGKKCYITFGIRMSAISCGAVLFLKVSLSPFVKKNMSLPKAD